MAHGSRGSVLPNLSLPFLSFLRDRASVVQPPMSFSFRPHLPTQTSGWLGIFAQVTGSRRARVTSVIVVCVECSVGCAFLTGATFPSRLTRVEPVYAKRCSTTSIKRAPLPKG